MVLEFGEWVWQLHPHKPSLARLVKMHIEFFERLDSMLEHSSKLDAAEIANTLSVAYQRKHLLCKRFLAERYGIKLAEEEQHRLSEEFQIRSKLTSASTTEYGTLLMEYVKALAKQNLALRTQRLYLRAAELVCIHAELSNTSFGEQRISSTQRRLESYSKRHKGSYASALRFVRFLRESFQVELTLIPPKKSVKRMPTTVKRLAILMRSINEVGIKRADTNLIVRLTGIAFGYPALSLEQIVDGSEDGSELVIRSESLKIPIELHPYVKELTRRIKTRDENRSDV